MTDLLPALRRLKVETGSLACLGCGHEHNCDLHGCAILREAITALETRPEVVRCHECVHDGSCDVHDAIVARFETPFGGGLAGTVLEPELYCPYGICREDGDA